VGVTARAGIRFFPDTGWELRCETCSHDREQSYWPLTLEFWNPKQGMTRCRACWTALARDRRRAGRGGHRLSVAARQESLLRTRAYQREWAARKRADQRAAEGRRRYERLAA
jgi:hypothetical protein